MASASKPLTLRNPVLAPLGISTTAEQVYGLLLRTTDLTEAGLAAAAGIGDLDARRALAELVDAGLALRRDGHLVAAPPQIALEAVVQRRMRELEGARVSIAQLQEDYRQYVAGQVPVDMGDIVMGREDIARRFGQVIRLAQREVRAFETPPYASPPSYNPLEVDRLAEGVRFRAVYSRDALGAPDALAALKQHVEAGEEARTLPDVPLKMCLADDRIALLPLVTGSEGVVESALCVVAPAVVQALAELFELVWQKAWPIGPGIGDHTSDGSIDVPGEMRPDLTEQDRQLLVLVAAGLKDDAIARQLGLGARTVQRRLSALAHRMGASNRLDLVRTALHLGLV